MSLFLYLTWGMRAWCLLIWNSMKGWTFPMLNATETIKAWSKRKHFKVSEFSISSIIQNRKLGNFGNRHFFLSNGIVKLKFFFVLVHFSIFRASYTTKSWNKRKPSQIFEFSFLRIAQNWKLQNLRNWCIPY